MSPVLISSTSILFYHDERRYRQVEFIEDLQTASVYFLESETVDSIPSLWTADESSLYVQNTFYL